MPASDLSRSRHCCSSSRSQGGRCRPWCGRTRSHPRLFLRCRRPRLPAMPPQARTPRCRMTSAAAACSSSGSMPRALPTRLAHGRRRYLPLPPGTPGPPPTAAGGRAAARAPAVAVAASTLCETPRLQHTLAGHPMGYRAGVEPPRQAVRVVTATRTSMSHLHGSSSGPVTEERVGLRSGWWVQLAVSPPPTTNTRPGLGAGGPTRTPSRSSMHLRFASRR